MRIAVVTGSRADYGLLEWPIKVLREEFQVDLWRLWSNPFHKAFEWAQMKIEKGKPDLMLVLGDRFEVLGAVTAAYLVRLPIAHIGGGDVTEGSYDNAMRDAISRMASIHFVTSTSAMARLSHMGFGNIHLVGNPGIDYIKNADWKRERPIKAPYVVVSYQPETIDGTNEIADVLMTLPVKHKVFILPNPDRGSGAIASAIKSYAKNRDDCTVHEYLGHAEFLNLIAHCEEFIGNSSSMLYEAPELGIRTRMIGKRQRGRTIPMGDGFASQRIANILKYTHV
ncbi:MAG: UDP-N-acetylglucosamine 2-epimerase [Candidatus Binatia bacterium]|nr:UDP-N-acetylglucosamine 2-epimerase [Candidatus Binatia bacterium]